MERNHYHLLALLIQQTYTVWVNATDPAGSGLYTRMWYTFTTIGSGNNRPIFGIPSPSNGSINRPLSLTWSIPINDTEGNLFNWTINCSNGQNKYGIGETNGTKLLSLTGLAYSTAYTVWVNATDPAGSGLYTRSGIRLRQWLVVITDPYLVHLLPPTVQSIGLSVLPGVSRSTILKEISSIGPLIAVTDKIIMAIRETNGTKSLSLTGLAYSTAYTVWVNATDPAGSGLYTRMWYTFTTIGSGNNRPIFGIPSPSNGSINSASQSYLEYPN